jgi:hypothetical protein
MWLTVRKINIAIPIKITLRRVAMYNHGDDCFILYFILSLLNCYVIVFFAVAANVRVYEPLRCQSALLSSYHKETKSDTLRKPAASNGLYTLL